MMTIHVLLKQSIGGAGKFTAIYQHPGRFATAMPTAAGFSPWHEPAKGYVTQYASDRPDKTGDVWEWLFK